MRTFGAGVSLIEDSNCSGVLATSRSVGVAEAAATHPWTTMLSFWTRKTPSTVSVTIATSSVGATLGGDTIGPSTIVNMNLAIALLAFTLVTSYSRRTRD